MGRGQVRRGKRDQKGYSYRIQARQKDAFTRMIVEEVRNGQTRTESKD